MLYSLVPLLIASLGIFITPHFIRGRGAYPSSIKLVALLSSLLALLILLLAPKENPYPYLFKEDSLSLIFSLLAGFVGFITILFSTWYVEENHREYYSAMLLFIASMIGLAISNNILLFVLCWEVTTVVSFMLIRMRGTEKANAAANKVLMLNQVGGMALLICAAYLYLKDVHTIDVLLTTPDMLAAFLLIFAAITKSAVFPFHLWLPSAMEAYAPVSALLHSAAMVMAGMYLLIRIASLLLPFAELRMLILLLGLLTVLASSMKAFLEDDLKRVLACSTLTNIGMVTICVSLASPFSIGAALFHIISHALFKASLFLEAGVFEHSFKTRDINKLGGAVERLPVTTFFFTLSAISAMGIPVTLGFLSKFAMYESTLPFLSLLLLFGAVLAVGYYAPILGFVLKRMGGRGEREGKISLLSIAPLSLGSVLLAAYPYPLIDICSSAVRELLGVDFSLPIPLSPSLLPFSILLTIAMLLLLSRRRITVPFRSGEPLRGSTQTPSSQLSGVRAFANKLYPLLDVERAYFASGPAGRAVYDLLSSLQKLVEVK